MMTKQPIKLEDLSLDPEKYYMFFPLHHGDTFLAAGLVRWFENSVGGKVCCLVRPGQEFVMRLYERTDYEIIEWTSERSPDFWEKLRDLSNLCPQPRKGKVFVAFPTTRAHPEYCFRIPSRLAIQAFYVAFMYGCNEPIAEIFQHPTDRLLRVDAKFTERINSISTPENIILFSPESASWIPSGWGDFSRPFWEEQARIWRERGYKVVVSSINPTRIPGTTHLPMTMEEALWLGIRCRYVVAQRSGYMDILAHFRKDETATIIYTSYRHYFQTNFFESFNRHFDEIIMPRLVEKLEQKREDEKKMAEMKTSNERVEKIVKAFCEQIMPNFTGSFSHFATEISTANDALSKVVVAPSELQREAKILRQLFIASEKFRIETENARNNALREIILLPFMWLNLQRCRLGSHLFFGKIGGHYTKKKRMLRKRIDIARRWLNL